MSRIELAARHEEGGEGSPSAPSRPVLVENPRDAGYGFEPVYLSDWPRLLTHLHAGYADRPPQWWAAGHARMCRVPTNAPSQPIGVIILGPPGPIGVLLYFASERPSGGAQAPQLHINLSSGFIAQEYRGERAAFCARRTTSVPGAVYTTLTPIDATVGIMRRLRFEPVSHQQVRVLTPQIASRGARVLGGIEALAELRDHPMHRLFEDHFRLGCMVCAVETSSGWHPLVLQRRLRKFGISVLEVIYASSTAALLREIGTLSQFLLRHGYLVLEFEANAYAPIEIPAKRLFRIRLARGPYPRRGIDHLYSELVYLHR